MLRLARLFRSIAMSSDSHMVGASFHLLGTMTFLIRLLLLCTPTGPTMNSEYQACSGLGSLFAALISHQTGITTPTTYTNSTSRTPQVFRNLRGRTNGGQGPSCRTIDRQISAEISLRSPSGW